MSCDGCDCAGGWVCDALPPDCACTEGSAKLNNVPNEMASNATAGRFPSLRSAFAAAMGFLPPKNSASQPSGMPEPAPLVHLRLQD